MTDVVLTHAHYDHAVNFTLFPSATVWIGATELAWAAAQPPGFNPLPELYVQELSRSPKVRRIEAGEEFLPGLTAIAAPGHTPGSLVFLLTGTPTPMLFSGDAAKNRAELLSGLVDATANMADGQASLEVIWRHWRAHPGTILVPGHDLCMALNASGRPVYIGERRAAISAWFHESLAEETVVDLCAADRPGLFTQLVSGAATPPAP